MNELSLEQKKQLDSWASQRDAILVDISNKRTEKEALIKTNKDLASSNTEIANKIEQSIGRLLELEKKEEERAKLTTSEIALLISQKSKLEGDVSLLNHNVAILLDSKEALFDDIERIRKIHEAVFSRTSEIERIVGETITINSTNAREIVSILAQAGAELKKVIDIGSENVVLTQRLVAEIPKVVVDLHRDVIERKKIGRANLTK